MTFDLKSLQQNNCAVDRTDKWKSNVMWNHSLKRIRFVNLFSDASKRWAVFSEDRYYALVRKESDGRCVSEVTWDNSSLENHCFSVFLRNPFFVTSYNLIKTRVNKVLWWKWVDSVQSLWDLTFRSVTKHPFFGCLIFRTVFRCVPKWMVLDWSCLHTIDPFKC